MNRSLVLVIGFLGLASVSSPPPASATHRGYPVPVLRLRGGLVFPDPDYDPGPGWLAGGSIGFALNRDVLLSLSYDHLYLDVRETPPRKAALDPVTLELELGRQGEHRFTPRIAAGAGLYFRRETYPDYRIYWYQPHSGSSLGKSFGVHFGAGLSIPVWKRTLLDFDARYHQTVGQGSGSTVVGTASAGLRFLLPGGGPDPEGYVESGKSPAYALR